jgi:hypothetical protein
MRVKRFFSRVIATSIVLSMLLLSGVLCQKSQRENMKNSKAAIDRISTGKDSSITADSTAQTKDIESFLHELVGEWIGKAERSTNGIQAATTYFHGVAAQVNPGIYQFTIKHFKLDKKTHALVRNGVMVMTMAINPDGTAKNSIRDSSEVFLNPSTSKPENTLLSEILRISPSGSLEGNGSGKISVQGTTLNAGKNGKVSEYTSEWKFDNGALSIKVQLKAMFHVLSFSKRYQIVNHFKAQRGNNIMSLTKQAGDSSTPNP